jgi:hypothetical protein
MSTFRRVAGWRLACAAVLLLTASCARPATTGAVLEVAGRTNAYVTLASDGAKVGAVWAAGGPTGRDIYFAVSTDGGRRFGRPVRVSDGTGQASASGEQAPRVVMHASVIDVVWVTKRDGMASIATAESQDGGATFSVPRIITPAGVSGARGWESAAVSDDGSVHVAWLDGRHAGRRVSGGHGDARGHSAHWRASSSSRPGPTAGHLSLHLDRREGRGSRIDQGP